jgi:RimJ/RimL family protein N-acetyltransferase
MIAPITLEGRLARLEPLTIHHVESLWTLAQDSEIWRWTGTRISSPDEARSYVETALRWREQGTGLPFVIRHRPDGELAGSTRYGNIVPEHRRLEIGWTWLARRWHRTGLNRECKLLLLEYAFETLKYNRVEIKTDVLNTVSRKAIEGIGAKQEGILRRHMITPDGRVRDTVYYSIIAGEWPEVKQRLQAKLHQGGT